MYVGTLGPHDPYIVPEKYLELYPLEKIELPESFEDDLADRPNLYRRTQKRFRQLTEEEQKRSLQHYLAFCSYEDALFGEILERAGGQRAAGPYDRDLSVGSWRLCGSPWPLDQGAALF